VRTMNAGVDEKCMWIKSHNIAPAIQIPDFRVDDHRDKICLCERGISGDKVNEQRRILTDEGKAKVGYLYCGSYSLLMLLLA
jgi:hypothetical protein